MPFLVREPLDFNTYSGKGNPDDQKRRLAAQTFSGVLKKLASIVKRSSKS